MNSGHFQSWFFFFLVVTNGSTVPLIHRAEGVVHWFQVELMTTQLHSATCKTELLEKCWNIYQYSWFFTQLSILICNLFKPQAVLALVTEVFSNWLKFWSQVHKNRNNSWSLSHKCGFWESNPTWRPRFKVQIFHKFQLWGLVMKKKTNHLSGSKRGPYTTFNSFSVPNFFTCWTQKFEPERLLQNSCFLMNSNTYI